ncbi:ABC transporter substrate-binding protein [Peptoniphilus indolicus]|nr:ABC transporter substrate-binding protein [Peptoniphilus indolicus]SUB75692.1 Stage 0 sporulation protein KA [Peptoniphilus indolicus]
MKKKIFIIMFLILSLIIVSCTNKSKEVNSSDDKKSKVATADIRTEDNVLNVGSIKDFKTSKEGHSLIFDSLTRIDHLYKPIPWLVTKWEISKDYMEYDLFYNTNVKFHDGTMLTGDALKYNIETGGTINYCSYSYVLDNVEVVEDGHLKVKLNAPYLYLLQDLSKIPAVPKDSLDDKGNKTSLVGTGPFKFVETTQAEISILKKNDDYWDKNYKTDIDTINWHAIADEQTRKLALESGQIDVLGLTEHYISLPYSTIYDFKKNKNYNIVKESDENYTSVASINSNWKTGKMSDINLRKAILTMFDREELVKTVLFGIPNPCGYLYNPKFEDGPDENSELKYDLNMSKKYLEKAGYKVGNESTPTVDKDGKVLDMKFIIDDEEYQKDVSIYLKSQAAKLGVNLNIEVLSGAKRIETIKSGNFDLIMSHPWFVPLIDSLGYMGLSDDYSDYGLGYGINQEMKDAGKNFIEATDPSKIKESAQDIWKIQQDEAVSTPLFSDIRYIIHNKKFEGFKFDGNVFQIDLNGVRRVEDESSLD